MNLADIASLAVLLAVISLYTQPSAKVSWILSASMADNSSARPVLLFLIFFGLKNLAAFFIYRAQTHFSHHVGERISRAQLMAYLNGNYLDYVAIDSAARIHHISHEPVEFAQYILTGIQQICMELILALLAICGILLFNAKLFAVLVIFLVPPIVLTGWITKQKLRKVRRHIKEDYEKTTQYLQEALNGYVESNMYDRKEFFANRYSTYKHRLGNHLSQLQITQWVPSRVVEVFAVTGLFILVLLNKYGGHVTDIVSIGAFMAAAYKIIPGIVRIANLAAQVKTYEHTVYDLQDTLTANIQKNTSAIPPITSISFRHISFMHPGNNVLQNFSLDINSGDFTDIVAPSGKGKTTLVHLLMGFLIPDLGEILINHHVADTAAIQDFRQRIAYVKQQPFLIHDTIRRNITLEENTSDEDRFNAAIQVAGLDVFIRSFPEEAEKIISDNGKNISGGQRKRIAIARALYKNADVIVLDEPFSELDETSERMLLQHFKNLAAQGKIVILITHNRISSEYCNKTVLLHE
ncbi:ATP-binding cassette domain-containing protein [Chitinophagaceae bacterium MMS25-I14]